MQTDSARKLGAGGDPWGGVDVGRGGLWHGEGVVSRVSGDIVLWEVMLKVRGGIFLEGP